MNYILAIANDNKGDSMDSVWSTNNELKTFNKFENDISTDVIIIGGGLAGILTAYRLKEKGISSVLIEANRICSGQTKNTSAKITSQHGIIYSKIEKHYSSDFSKQYAKANEQAIRNYRRIINDKAINCDFEYKTAYLYSIDKCNSLKEEAEAAKRAGIDCFCTTNTSLPFSIACALGFRNQAQFNPLKFADALTEDITIYENTPAIRIEKNQVITPNATVTAENIVVACNYPFINFPSLYFLRMSRERSYITAIKPKEKYNLDGMYIGIGSNTMSLRNYGNMILLGGCAHRTGVAPNENPYEMLSLKADELFAQSEKLYQWSAQDCITIDSIPYIGRFNKNNNNIFIATGFNKWGMSSSMVSADIISDMICGRVNENSAVFSPERFNLSASIEHLITNTFETIKGFSAHLKPSFKGTEFLENDQADEIIYNGKKVGAYKDCSGRIYIVSLTCPHLKCKLSFNKATKSWDCPCHGSRYSYKGNLIDNPAQKESILIKII